MSSSEEKSRDSSPRRGSRRSSLGTPRASRQEARHEARHEPRHEARQSRANVIEFVDSQDPNVKSAIQRHTAYHSAAQRREARLKSLRRSNQSRFLEWGRRQGTGDAPPVSPSSSASSLPLSPVVSLQGTERPTGVLPTGGENISPPSSELQSLATTPSRESTTSNWSSAEDALIEGMSMLSASSRILTSIDVRKVCPHTAHEQLFRALITFLRCDEACTQLLLAYCHAARAKKQSARAEAEKDQQAAQQRFVHGTNILWNRLRDPSHASSDVNIQAVLMLVAYTSDFGQTNEVDIHADALRTMVRQRGGIDALQNNSILHQQLQMLDTSRTDHLTLDCVTGCSRPLRFANGFWTVPVPSPPHQKAGTEPES